MNTKLTIHIDASSLRLSSCILAFYRTVIEGYRSPINSADIEFGSSFHLFRKTYEENGKEELTAIAAATKYLKSIPKYYKPKKEFLDGVYLMDVCEQYNRFYQFDTYQTVINPATNKPLVEVQFAYPYLLADDLEVVLCGTIDRIVYNTVGDFYAIADYKTTSVWNKDDYLSSYVLSSQLMFYNYALRKYAKLFPSSVIAKVCAKPLGAFIDGIFLGSGKDPGFQRSEVFYFDDGKMADFEKGLGKAVARIVEVVRDRGVLYREGMMNGSCEKVWGKCGFFGACSESRDDSRDMILKENFSRRVYNPLMFGKDTA